MIKYGFWNVKFDLTLEGEEIRWEDLDEVAQEHIADMIKEGYTGGDICIEEDNPICIECEEEIDGIKFKVAPNEFYCRECFFKYLDTEGHSNLLEECLSLETIAKQLNIEVIE